MLQHKQARLASFRVDVLKVSRLKDRSIFSMPMQRQKVDAEAKGIHSAVAEPETVSSLIPVVTSQGPLPRLPLLKPRREDELRYVMVALRIAHTGRAVSDVAWSAEHITPRPDATWS